MCGNTQLCKSQAENSSKQELGCILFLFMSNFPFLPPPVSQSKHNVHCGQCLQWESSDHTVNDREAGPILTRFTCSPRTWELLMTITQISL